MRTWKWATIASTAFSAAVTIVYVTILAAAGNGDVGWMLPRLMQLAVYLSAMTAVACAERFNHEVTRNRNDHHDRRTDQRMQSIGNAMIEHGIHLDAITGEIPRVRPLIVACTHNATHPVGRASVSGGLDPTVLEMGDRIARRLQGD
jgi:hypothetical protein